MTQFTKPQNYNMEKFKIISTPNLRIPFKQTLNFDSKKISIKYSQFLQKREISTYGQSPFSEQRVFKNSERDIHFGIFDIFFSISLCSFGII